MRLLVDGRQVALTTHAVERYSERVSRFDGKQARVELAHVAKFATVQTAPPAWLGSREADGWLLLADGIAFPLRQQGPWMVATTCVCRAECEEQTRLARRAAKRSARQARKTKRRVARQQPGRPDAGWRDDSPLIAP